MSTEALLKLLIAVAVPGIVGVLGLTWKASRDWTRVGLHVDELIRQVRDLVGRIDTMAGQLDSVRLWRREHQATSDAQLERLEHVEREVSR